MRPNSKYKLFYIHTPKTAGSSVNEYFKHVYPNSVTHIEGQLGRNPNFPTNNYDFASGHIGFNRAERMLDENWLKVITLREPYSFVISHLCWIRLLADPDQKVRFKRHPAIIQKVSTKMAGYDLSQPKQISEFITWLNTIGYNYLHNTQTFYLDSGKNINDAMEALNRIEFVGTLEKIDDFLSMINYELNLNHKFLRAPRENVNNRKYGLDIDNPEIRKALLPLINKDILLYEMASSKLDDKLALYKKDLIKKDIKGFVDGVRVDRVSGWAMSKSSYQHLNVGLYLNGKLVIESVANIFRLGLKRKGIHYTGCAAFSLSLKGLSINPGDEMSVREAKTGKLITLSAKAMASLANTGIVFEDSAVEKD